jgi:hypothetical protein
MSCGKSFRDRVVVGFTSSVYVVSDFDKGDDF